MHQIAPILKNLSGEHAPETPYQTRGFATRCMAQSAMQIPPLFHKNFEPPLKWNSRYATGYTLHNIF